MSASLAMLFDLKIKLIRLGKRRSKKGSEREGR